VLAQEVVQAEAAAPAQESDSGRHRVRQEVVGVGGV